VLRLPYRKRDSLLIYVALFAALYGLRLWETLSYYLVNGNRGQVTPMPCQHFEWVQNRSITTGMPKVEDGCQKRNVAAGET